MNRQKWTDEEDEILKDLHNKYNSDFENWEEIAKEMKRRGIHKNEKQIRDHWRYQLDPTVKKDQFSEEENRRLFIYHKEHGNHWKKISREYKGRTDNYLKNQFFVLIRKSLRKASILIQAKYPTEAINKIKPKVLAEFLSVTVPFPEGLCSDYYVPFMDRNRQLSARNFVEFFAFTKQEELARKINNELTRKAIKVLLDELEKRNREYCSQKLRCLSDEEGEKSQNPIKKTSLSFCKQTPANHQVIQEIQSSLAELFSAIVNQERSIEVIDKMLLNSSQKARAASSYILSTASSEFEALFPRDKTDEKSNVSSVVDKKEFAIDHLVGLSAPKQVKTVNAPCFTPISSDRTSQFKFMS